jgi:hypothetical protein
MKYAATVAFLVMGTYACHAQTRPPQTLTPTVVSGKQSQVGFFYGLNPDCSTRGEGDTRLIKKPEHGTVEFTPGESYPNFPDSSPWFHCNKQKAPGTLVMYKSDDGYTGKEYFDVEFIGPRGADLITRYVITVK